MSRCPAGLLPSEPIWLWGYPDVTDEVPEFLGGRRPWGKAHLLGPLLEGVFSMLPAWSRPVPAVILVLMVGEVLRQALPGFFGFLAEALVIVMGAVSIVWMVSFA